MSTMLSAIRAAAQPQDANDDPNGTMPGASASSTATQTTEDDMSEADNKSGATISSADHEKAVAAATATGKAEGHKEGAKAANDRMGAIFGADGIKGDGKRMAAALDLATSSPGMSAEAVTTFVVGNVSVSAAAESSAQTYEQRRLAAAGLAQPPAHGSNAAPKATIDRNAIFAARRAAGK